MLRRKLILWMGSLVALMLVASFAAILLLDGILADLNRVSASAIDRSAHTESMGTTLTAIEGELNGLLLGRRTHLDDLIEFADTLEHQVAALDGVMAGVADETDETALTAPLRDLTDRLADLVAARDPRVTTERIAPAREAALAVRNEFTTLNAALQRQTEGQFRAVTGRFRWTVFGLAIVFLVMINISIVVLIRAATSVIRPVDKLVEASRRLAREDFGYRVDIPRRDEFGELARASNALAEQLQRNEQRKIETLHQVARTLSHELNNAISIIELQLQLVARSSVADGDQAGRLREIHCTLERMTGTVAALSRVRRIVLTDYSEGVKMLDLERSVDADQVSTGDDAAPAVSVVKPS